MSGSQAHNTANKRALPGDILINLDRKIPIRAFNTGIKIGNPMTKEPVFLKSSILLAATSPISKRKKVSIP